LTDSLFYQGGIKTKNIFWNLKFFSNDFVADLLWDHREFCNKVFRKIFKKSKIQGTDKISVRVFDLLSTINCHPETFRDRVTISQSEISARKRSKHLKLFVFISSQKIYTSPRGTLFVRG